MYQHLIMYGLYDDFYPGYPGLLGTDSPVYMIIIQINWVCLR